MKKHTFIFIFLISILGTLNAQWIKTSGPNFNFYPILSLATSGNNIYAGIWGKGVYLSTNNGDSWISNNKGLTDSVHVKVIAVKGNKIFAGTYAGVFFSSDSGNNWTKKNNGLPGSHIVSLAIKGDTIFAGVDGKGVYRSTNNGNYWVEVNNGLPPNMMVRCPFAIKGDTIYIGNSNDGTGNGGVYLSTNNGNSWSAANIGLTSTSVLALAKKGNTIFAGTSIGVFASSNSGGSWIPMNNGISGSHTIKSLIVKNNIIFTGTEHWNSDVYYSLDYGSSWVNTNIPVSQGKLSLAISNDTLFVGTYQDGIWKSAISVLVGIKKTISNTNQFIIYPNPAKDILTIESILNLSIEISNMQGQIIYQQIFEQGKTEINISKFSKGIYIIKAIIDGNINVMRFIKD